MEKVEQLLRKTSGKSKSPKIHLVKIKPFQRNPSNPNTTNPKKFLRKLEVKNTLIVKENE